MASMFTDSLERQGRKDDAGAPIQVSLEDLCGEVRQELREAIDQVMQNGRLINYIAQYEYIDTKTAKVGTSVLFG